MHAVRQAAYSQEAAILGVEDFPPLHVRISELRESKSRFFGVRKAARIVAVLELDSGAGAVCISSLVVSPADQRQGIGRALLCTAIAAASGKPIEVQTALRNERALGLYRTHGFHQINVCRLASGLELIRLRHNGNAVASRG